MCAVTGNPAGNPQSGAICKYKQNKAVVTSSQQCIWHVGDNDYLMAKGNGIKIHKYIIRVVTLNPAVIQLNAEHTLWI